MIHQGIRDAVNRLWKAGKPPPGEIQVDCLELALLLSDRDQAHAMIESTQRSLEIALAQVENYRQRINNGRKA